MVTACCFLVRFIGWERTNQSRVHRCEKHAHRSCLSSILVDLIKYRIKHWLMLPCHPPTLRGSWGGRNWSSCHHRHSQEQIKNEYTDASQLSLSPLTKGPTQKIVVAHTHSGSSPLTSMNATKAIRKSHSFKSYWPRQCLTDTIYY